MCASTDAVFRLRFCHAQACGTLFWICRACDRGHRYCSERCRHKARRHQGREANRRHQQSPEGRLDHRDRQRAYRDRCRARVTDQGRRRLDPLARMARAQWSLTWKSQLEQVFTAREEIRAPSRWSEAFRGVVCIVCGRSSRFVDPFHESG